MRKTLFVVGTLLVAISLLLGACESTPAPNTSTPQVINSTVTTISSTNYPADISGKVTIVDKISFIDSKSGNQYTWDGDGGLYKYWVIDLSVKNIAYSNPIKSFYLYSDPLPKGIGYTDVWSLVSSNNKLIDILFNNYSGSFQGEGNFIPNNLSIKNCEVGKFTLIFGVMNSSVSDTRIVYHGEEPCSYGSLTLADKVSEYDWTTKTVINETKQQPEQQIVKETEIQADGWDFKLGSVNWNGGELEIKLTITNLGERRNFGLVNLLNPGPELAVVDSTNKLVQPFVSGSISKNDIVVNFPSYTHEFYPGESLDCNLKFEMSQYSEQVGLWYSSSGSWTLLLPIISSNSNDVIRTANAMKFGYYKLFDLGSAK